MFVEGYTMYVGLFMVKCKSFGNDFSFSARPIGDKNRTSRRLEDI